jgi:FkbM family methyltransferase
MSRSYWKRIKDRIREWNHARLERRRRRKAERPDRKTVLAALTASDSSILEGLIYLVEAAQEERASRREGLEAIAALQRAMEEGLAGLKAIAAPREGLLASSGPAVQTGRYELLNPEVDLLAHLAPHIPARTAIDVGANIGQMSTPLLDLGFEVHAFEPFPPVFERLRQRLSGRPGFFPHSSALGPADGEMDLYLATDRSGGAYGGGTTLYSSLVVHAMPPDLPLSSSVRVPVRSLASLHRAKEVPEDVGIVKIDTEGYDLQVIRGMGEHRYSLVMAEFWDPEMEFGKAGALNRLEDLVSEMRGRGYAWHVVLFRVWGEGGVGYYCNRSASVERSWGNVLFFRDHGLFEHARRWCAASVPEARFSAKVVTGEHVEPTRPVASANAK